ncbi:MAG: hypothetical protein ACRBN8_02265 [Nannocystales bacterium]
MRLLVSTAALVILALSTPEIAGATSGGEKTISFLGYAARDGKAYFQTIRHGDGEGRTGQIYMTLSGPRAGTVVEVRSWPRAGPPDETAEDGEGNIDRLVARLRQGKKERRWRFAAQARRVRRLTWQPNPLDPPVYGERLRVRVRSADHSKAGVVVLDSYGCLGTSGLAAPPQALGPCRKVRVARAFRLPAVDATVAIVEAIGLPYEGGYSVEHPVLLTPQVRP